MFIQLIKSINMKSIEKIKNLAPHDRFRWCVRGVIRNHAKLAFFDLFDETFQRSLGYYFLLFIFGLISFGASYAMWTHVGDLAHQLFEFGVVMTYVQVGFLNRKIFISHSLLFLANDMATNLKKIDTVFSLLDFLQILLYKRFQETDSGVGFYQRRLPETIFGSR